MLRGEEQVEFARLRMELRFVDAEIVKLRQESRRYRQMRFGLDFKEIQLTALQDQRSACRARMAELRKQASGCPEPRRNPLAWLLVPLALLQWIQRPQSRPAARYAREAPGLGRELTAVGAGR